MTAKYYLRGYKRLTALLRVLDDEIRALEAEIDSVSVGSGISSSEPANRTERIALKLVEAEERQRRLRAAAWSKREEIEGVILMSPDGVQGRLLYDRYILDMSWQDISEDIHYSEQYCRGQLHSMALQNVTRFIPVEEGTND